MHSQKIPVPAALKLFKAFADLKIVRHFSRERRLRIRTLEMNYCKNISSSTEGDETDM